MQKKTANETLITEISNHTVKKFEIIEQYVITWAHKLLQLGLTDGRLNGKCNGLLFIDCMSNSGLYTSREDGSMIEGTPIRVAKVLSSIMREANYQNQQAFLYFNDLSAEKIALLEDQLPPQTHNFHWKTSVGDGNEMISSMAERSMQFKFCPYLMLYDPYQAQIDWSAIEPYLNHWGEVIINHMVMDSMRAVGSVKKPGTMKKYMGTYDVPAFEIVQSFGSDKKSFENRIKEIIREKRTSRSSTYYIASVPFFNKCNALVYNLIHCTSSIEGYKLFKTTAWKVFGDRSSGKREKELGGQMSIDMFDCISEADTHVDCYHITDIARYIYTQFKDRMDVPIDDVWSYVDEHPVFPTDGFKQKIESELKLLYHAEIKNRPKRISFKDVM